MTYTCQACGYQWLAKPGLLQLNRTKPRKCPSCQSRRWDKERKG